jgi:hypothetical protein
MWIGPRTDKSFDLDALTWSRVFERRRVLLLSFGEGGDELGPLTGPAVKAAASRARYGLRPGFEPRRGADAPRSNAAARTSLLPPGRDRSASSHGRTAGYGRTSNVTRSALRAAVPVD